MDCVMSFPDPRTSPRRALRQISPNSPQARSEVKVEQVADDQEEVDVEKPVLHIEARLKQDSNIRFAPIRTLLFSFISQTYDTLCQESLLHDWQDVDVLNQHLEEVRVAECAGLEKEVVPLDEVELQIHVYQPTSNVETTHFSTNANDSGETDGHTEEDVQAASVTELPNTLLDGIWANLFYDDGIKENLLNFIYSTLLFGNAGIDFNVISYNRMCLFFGPPGSGKTSLAKALAQKLSIRLSNTYTHGKIVEINAHSLFSKWFSESGKLVQRLFAGILEMVEDEGAFVVVLIDEVESLTSARAGAVSGKEPSDALRVVNALLTNLDKLKTKKNVLVVTTSNLSHAIDPAFVDRADIKQYVGLPSKQAIYWILTGCLNELAEKGLIASPGLLDWKTLAVLKGVAQRMPTPSLAPATASQSTRSQERAANEDKKMRASSQLFALAEACHTHKMSGRFLRRLPILAHARHLVAKGSGRLPVASWLTAMGLVVQEEVKQMELVAAGGSE